MGKRFVIAFIVSLANISPAFAGDQNHGISPSLMSELNTWLDAETEFVRRDSLPHVRLISLEQAEQLHGVADRAGGHIRGLYDVETATIYLTDPWSAADPRDISVLLHEMVHHRQAARYWYCQQAQEWRAYQIQAQWLTEQNIQDEFYWPAILLQSSCTKRDIHPD